MNEILQKRIEEATNIMFGHQAIATEAMKYILQHLWISVEEALPEDTELYFVAYKAMDRVLYSTGCYEAKFKEWYVDGYGYNADVTHWMPIPSLEGGEK